MNELNEIDKALLASIKNKTEHLAGLSGNADLSQKDFDFLQYYIQEKTCVALSLTTLKRIWRKEYQRLPHLSTLNMLSQLAYDLDWHTAKKQFLSQQPDVDHLASPVVQSDRKKISGKLFLVTLIGAAGLAGLSWYYVMSRTGGNIDNIQFSAQVTTNLAIPNSVVFSYDVAGFGASKFYIQQSWDPAKMVEVSANNKKQTDIYFEPGYHYAKLLGNQQVLKEIPVHIKYNDWYVR